MYLQKAREKATDLTEQATDDAEDKGQKAREHHLKETNNIAKSDEDEL